MCVSMKVGEIVSGGIGGGGGRSRRKRLIGRKMKKEYSYRKFADRKAREWIGEVIG